MLVVLTIVVTHAGVISRKERNALTEGLYIYIYIYHAQAMYRLMSVEIQ